MKMRMKARIKKTRKTAQGVVAGLFCVTLVAYAAVCLWTHGPEIYAALSKIARPLTVREARAAVAALEDILHENLYRGALLSEAHARVQRFMGKQEADGFAVLRDEAGFLEYGRIEAYPAALARAHAGALWRLQTRAEARGAKLLFIAPPPRHRPYAGELYAADMPYPDLHAFCDALFYHLHRYGVAGLDLRAEFLREGLPFETYTFRTDERLTAEAAFAAFRAAAATLNRDFGAALDEDGFYRNIKNYKKDTYKNAFLGVLGRRAGIAFGGLDDFTVLWPDFTSLCTLSSRAADGAAQTLFGPVATTLLRPSALTAAAKERNPYLADFYRVYADGFDLLIGNRAAPADAPRLLFIHDGGGAPLAVLLSPLFRELRVICPSAAADAGEDFDATAYLYDALEDFSPDYVIVESRAERLDLVLP
jgi:hypothetical protein